MIYHGFKQIKESSRIRLFKSYRTDEYAHGEQLRDFVYVKDVCQVILWFLNNKHVSGLFNVGTCEARSFNDLGKAIFKALGLTPQIEYIDMPEGLREKYQYYTRATIQKLREAGYTHSFTSLENGVSDYVINYLNKDFRTY